MAKTPVNNPVTTDGLDVVEEQFALNLTDAQLIIRLRNEMKESETWWDKEFNLKAIREENLNLWIGKHYKNGELYDHETPVVDNRVFISLEAVLNHITSEIGKPETFPGGGKDRQGKPSEASLQMAEDLQKVLLVHAEQDRIDIKAKRVARNAQIFHVGLLKVYFNPLTERIESDVVDPRKVIVDRRAKEAGNPRFIGEYINLSLDQILSRFPDRQDQILQKLGLKRATQKALSQRYDIAEVWFTYYEEGKPCEGVCWFFQDTVLDKIKNPNWNYRKKAGHKANFLPFPPKPYVSMNLINDGQTYIDPTSVIQQASTLQYALNKNNRIILDNAEASSGTLVFSGKAVDAGEVYQLIGAPREKITVDADDVRAVAMRLSPDILPASVYQNKLDLRSEIDNVFGTPNIFRGEGSNNNTLGQDVIQKEQSMSRQSDFVKSVDDFMDRYYKLVTQLMKVYYTEDMYYQTVGSNGSFDFIMMKNDKIEDGVDVRVQAGSSVAVDKDRMQQIDLMLSKAGLIDPLSLFEDLGLSDPQERVKRLVEWQTDPTLTIENMKVREFDREAFIDISLINAKKTAEPRDEVDEPHLEYHTEYIKTGEFRKLPPDVQQAHIDHITLETENLRQRLLIEETQMPSQEEQAMMQQAMMPAEGEQPQQGGEPAQPNPSNPQLGSMPGSNPYPPGTPMAARSQQPGIM